MLTSEALGLMESIAIPFQELGTWNKKCTIKGFVQKTYRTDVMFRDMVYGFLDLVQTDTYIYNYDTTPEVVESCREYRHRFVVISLDGDYVLCMFKIVDPLGGDKRYVSLYRPVSLNRNAANEIQVLREFATISCVKSVICISEQYDADYYSNNYFNTLESYQRLLKEKGTRFRKVATLEKIIQCRVEDCCDEMLLYHIEFLNREWESWKDGKHCNNSADLNIARELNKGDSVQVWTYWYGDKIVAYQLIINTGEKRAVIYACKAISAWSLESVQEYLFCDKETANFIKRNIVRYTNYKVFEDFLVSGQYFAVYDLGDRKQPGMIEAKSSMFKRCTYYTREPIDTYLTESVG